MRIAIDYRPALVARTGVGEYIHQIASALPRLASDEITLFTSSWADRPSRELSDEMPGVNVVDRRVPVRVLNFAWHRLRWPPVEALIGGEYDVAHSPHPLLLPSRSAAQLVTIHDLHFLAHPDRTSREIRRDYPALAGSHARRADRIIVSSKFAAQEVQRLLDVSADKISVCPAGAPAWKGPRAGLANSGYVLFLGALDPRKNLSGLLEAYGRLLSRLPVAPPRLVIAGGGGTDRERMLEAIARPPLAGHVDYLGYVAAERREAIFKGARVFVLPSFEEGFGLPALEAMAAGVPVIVSNRGSLPEVVGDAGLLIDPDDPEGLVTALSRMLTEPHLRERCASRGLERAATFSWAESARGVRRAYEDALLSKRHRIAALSHAHRH